MRDSIIQKLESMRERLQTINARLSTPEVSKDQKLLRTLGRERSQLEKIVAYFNLYQTNLETIAATEAMLKNSDTDLKPLIHEEISNLHDTNLDLETKIKTLLLPSDPHDNSNIFLEIRAGTGGNEAAIFVGDLFRMYHRYAENNRWKVEVISASEGEYGGYKEIISRVEGKGAFSKLKFESGAHRVQRIPETESQGRIHTSAATVAVLPEADEIDDIEIDPTELRIDTFRASGAGGQHVNKTDSAIRITHLPSGLAIECQDDRSQHRNKARAIALLKARLLDAEQQQQQEQQAQTRKNLVGSGDRSERIRTYNFPQGRITDHRIDLTLYQLPKLMEGDMDIIINLLISELNTKQMTELENYQ